MSICLFGEGFFMGRYYVLNLENEIRHLKQRCDTAHEAIASAVMLGHTDHCILDTETQELHTVIDFIAKYV